MRKDRNINTIINAGGDKLVLINGIRFKGKRKIDWESVKLYLKEYAGTYYEIAESSEIICIGSESPEEFTESKSRKTLMGANAKAKANASAAIPKLIQIAINPSYEKNRKSRHFKKAKNGWYKYDIRPALPIYESEVLVRYNVSNARLLVNHAENGKRYSHDILAVKKETSRPQQSVW